MTFEDDQAYAAYDDTEPLSSRPGRRKIQIVALLMVGIMLAGVIATLVGLLLG